MEKIRSIFWKEKSWSGLTKEEWYAVGSLRIEVFVVEQNCPYQDFDRNDDKSDHVLGFNTQGELVAYSRILFPGVTYQEVSIGRVVVAKQARGLGVGQKLMKQSIGFVEKKYGQVPVHISAQEYLLDFYEKLGFRRVTQVYLEDDIPHVGMDLDW